MRIDDRPADRQSQPGAAGCGAAGDIGSGKGIEGQCNECCRKPLALICDHQVNPLVDRRDRDPDLTTIDVVSHGVVDQVSSHPRKFLGVAGHDGRPVGDHRDRLTLPSCQWSQ